MKGREYELVEKIENILRESKFNRFEIVGILDTLKQEILNEILED